MDPGLHREMVPDNPGLRAPWDIQYPHPASGRPSRPPGRSPGGVRRQPGTASPTGGAAGFPETLVMFAEEREAASIDEVLGDSTATWSAWCP